MKVDTITKEQRDEISARIGEFHMWLGKRTSYRTEEVPAGLAVSNDERAQVELYDFVHNPPDRYFLYIREDKETGRKTAINFTGLTLGTVLSGREYRCGFGWSKRQSISVHAINGYVYHGTYYKGSGDYARVKMSVESKKRLAEKK
jgi:hypothetical protein